MYQYKYSPYNTVRSDVGRNIWTHVVTILICKSIRTHHGVPYFLKEIKIVFLLAAPQRTDQVQPTNNSHPTDQPLYFLNNTLSSVIKK